MTNRTSNGEEFSVDVAWTSDNTAVATWWFDADQNEAVSTVTFEVRRDAGNDIRDIHGTCHAYKTEILGRTGEDPSPEMLAHCEDAVVDSIANHEARILRRDHGDGHFTGY